jgi:tripartite-type tricarboxylate transporter receptor subunit TctC
MIYAPANATRARRLRMQLFKKSRIHHGVMLRAIRSTWCGFIASSFVTVSALGLMTDNATAQSWPQRPVTLIIPYPPGGNVDTQARIMAERLSAKLGQPFIVQNKAGATGAIATDFVAKAEPDGYTLLFASSAQTTSVPMTEKVNYKPEDLIPISASGSSPMIMGVHAGFPAKTLKEFVEHVKNNPGKYNYASAGPGSIGHLTAALFLFRAKLDILHIPYKGGAPAVADLLGGQVQMYFGNAVELLPLADSDKVRLIAVSSKDRLKQIPQVQAVSEVLPGFEMRTWNGMLAPARTPQPIVDLLAKEIQAIAKEPAVIEKLASFGVDAISTSPDQFVEMLKAERGIYGEAIDAARLSRY